MYKHIFRMLPLAAILALAACQGGAPAGNSAAVADSLQVDSLARQVMDVHDEGMAKMMVIRRLKTRVTEMADSIGASKEAAAPYTQAGALLDSANNAMNTWMHAYDMQMEGKTTEEKKAYLQDEMKKISDVRDLMLKSIADTKQLLKEE
ncbi:hypothetical protein [Chitinophaga sp.]|uniref:hypothetical protein n=1 Tax=Chitinophaga sp. TaxID=1869181 RepID=UPI0031D9EF64